MHTILYLIRNFEFGLWNMKLDPLIYLTQYVLINVQTILVTNLYY